MGIKFYKYTEKSGTKSGQTGKAPAVAVLLALLASAALGLSCATKLPPIPAEMGSSELIQKAQEHSDVNDWKGAKYYYNALLERFPNDPALTIEAMYELAFIEYKQGNYEKARAGMQAVLARYAAQDGDSLPQTWKILAEKVLEKLPKTDPKTGTK